MYLLICIFKSRCTFGSSDHFCSLPIGLPRLEPQQLAPLLLMHVFLSTKKPCLIIRYLRVLGWVWNSRHIAAPLIAGGGSGGTRTIAASAMLQPLLGRRVFNRYFPSVCLVHDKKKYRRGAYCAETGC